MTDLSIIQKDATAAKEASPQQDTAGLVKWLGSLELPVGTRIEATLTDASLIPVEARFRSLCEEPRCPSFGSSLHCPPSSRTPSEFRALVESYRVALVFRWDVPGELLSGDGRLRIIRVLHDTTADLEMRARQSGFPRAAGFSAGGCRQTYCHEYDHCAGLGPEGACRHPDRARTSLSGLGLHVQALATSLGWSLGRGPLDSSMSTDASRASSTSGASGASGATGASGASGASGAPGASGASDASGATGAAGTPVSFIGLLLLH